MPDLPSGTVTFLFTDITGSPRLWEQHNDTISAAGARHDVLLREAVESHHGVVFKTIGDGGHAVFGSASDALAGAVTAQRAFQAEPWWDTAEPLQVRLALHTGVAELRTGDYFGPPLNRAARLLDAAHGGQILLSLVTAELVRDQLAPDLTLRDLGLHRLRDLTRPEQIFQLLAPDLPADFPSLHTLAYHPQNLPAQPTGLIGREWEVTNICNLLGRDDVRLVTLTGAGGCGKTRLALHAVVELLDQFSDGVYFVGLAPISDPNLVGPTIAQVLGVKATGERTIVDTLKDYLADQQLLLVLDNFEHLLEAALLVGELLSVASRLKLLVTSRSALRLSGEHEFSVPPLTLPNRTHLPPHDRLDYYEAVRLFVERAQAVRPDFALTAANAPVVVEICYRLDGLPLAIELAAARSKLFPPQALLERLSSPLTVLTSGPRDLPARQQTLRATIEWSYNLLPAPEQTLFARLAVFMDGCTLEVIEAVCGENANSDAEPVQGATPPAPGLMRQASSVVEGVELLLDQNLLQQVEDVGGEPRLIMLETICQYALDRFLASAEAQAVQQRHADYYLALAEEADSRLRGPEQGAWLARLEVEHNNLRAALEWYKTGTSEGGLRLAGALWQFWEMRSHLSEGRAWLKDLLPTSSGASGLLRARALKGAGVLAYLQGDYQQAITFLEESLTLFQDLHDNVGVAHILRRLGLAAWFQGDQNTARTQLEASVALFRTIPHPWGIADALHWLGHVVLDQGDVATAHALFEESLALFRQTGDKRNIALPLKDFGLMASLQGEHATARLLYEESLVLSREVEDTWHIAETLQRLGDLARLQGEYERADTLCQESLGLWRKLGNKGGIAETLNLLGETAQLQGDHQQATSFFMESLALLRALGSQRITARVLHNLGQAARNENDHERATALYLESLALNHEIEYTPGIADCLVGLAAVAAATDSAERAAQLLGTAEPHLDTIRGYMPLTDRTDYDDTMAAVRAQLDDAVFTAAFAQGRALSLEQAIAYAQAQPRPHEPGTALLKPASTALVIVANPAGLTGREVEVLRLVAQGLTDAQVAEQLVISPRTVNGHLRSIYSKLDVSSRTAAVHYAVTHHLV
ncbi:MAG: tetratricopeptide repeat protein [Anaerolineales bacterium]|nr:tetratricopeptide repeat protein [Anaerolineales bacterium]